MKSPVFLLVVLTFGLLLPLAAKPYENTAQVREARKEALHKQRRIIFNNDGNEPVYALKELSKEALLDERTAPLAGSQVDSLFYCTWSSGFGLFTHATKVGQLFTTKEAIFGPNRTSEMIGAGIDPLKVMAEFTAEHQMELFWSFRMNDTHDGSKTDYGPIMLRANRLKTEHPDWMIGSEAEKPKFGAWTAVDYTRPEIRDLAFQYTEEVCRNYDISGVELDFFRHPVFFKRAAMTGTPCNAEESALMTQLMRRIRIMTEEVAQLRGKPILLAVRVPDSTEYAKACGLDVETWLSEGLVDMLMASGYFQLNTWENSASLAHKYGAKAYPSLDESRVRDEKARALRMSVTAYRGRSAAALAAGMDGVYLFNSFNPRNPIWRELGSKEQLASLDKDYFASIRGVGAAAGGALPHAPFIQIPTLNPASPILIQPGASAKTTFNAGQESNQPSKVSILIHATAGTDTPNISAKLNGNSLETGVALDGDWIEFTAKQEWLRTGTNEVEVTTHNAAGKPTRWTDLRCTVRYDSKKTP
jgi:hypothetical protein